MPISCLDCGAPGIPTDGQVDTSDGTMFDATVIYSCDAGFIMNGVSQRTCKADQTWSNTQPSCDRISKSSP